MMRNLSQLMTPHSMLVLCLLGSCSYKAILLRVLGEGDDMTLSLKRSVFLHLSKTCKKYLTFEALALVPYFSIT